MISKFEAQSVQSVTEVPITSPPQRSQFGKLFINSGPFPDSGGTLLKNGQEKAPGLYSWEKLNFSFVTNIVTIL